MYTVETIKKGSKTTVSTIIDNKTGEQVTPLFLGYTCPTDYIKANVRPIEPMTAKEPLNDEELEMMLTSDEYIAEEKLDGTRCTMHLGQSNRLFSRRISKKTDWYAENSDSVPHLRDMETPKELYDTVLDGEMRIDGRDFKDVSSTLNCTWDEAIYRQTELGFITFHAFDIIYYKGVYVAKMPLIKRKALLRQVVEELNFEYVKEEFWTLDNALINITKDVVEEVRKYPSVYPNLAIDIRNNYEGEDLINIEVCKKSWYEYILMNNGEGIMLKSIHGTYKHTRGREYTKYKRFDTWDVIILDFVEPTEEYTGKELNTWQYWAVYRQGHLEEIIEGDEPDQYTRDHQVLPVTKHFAKGWIGTVKYGVIITDEELAIWIKNNPKEKPEIIECESYKCLVVGECSGMDENTREYMTKHKEELIGTVIEVGANELIKKTGKLRHPRFMRFRNDKEMERCIWKEHIR